MTRSISFASLGNENPFRMGYIKAVVLIGHSGISQFVKRSGLLSLERGTLSLGLNE